MADLLIICPTRGRPQNAKALYDSWNDTVTEDSRLCFAVDEDDPWLPGYRHLLPYMPEAWLLVGPRLRMVGSLNKAAVENTHHKYLGFLGDDHRPRTKGWDRRFIEALSAGGPQIAYGNDLLQGEKMATAVVMTSDIVKALGYMAPPAMVHLCIDLVWCDWGRAIDRLTYLDDVVLEHMHPANGKALQDEGYLEVNSSAMITADSAAYYAYKETGFHTDVAKLKALL